MAFMGTSVIDLLSVVQILQETYSGVKNLPREISDLSIEVTALREVLFALSRLPIHDGMKDLDRNSGFHNLVVSCGRTLTDIQQEVGQVFGIDKTKQIFRNGLIFYRMLKHADRIRDLKHDLDRHKATFSVLLSGFSIISTRTTTEGIENLQDRVSQLQELSVRQLVAYEESIMKANERQLQGQVLDWISTYDYRAAHVRTARVRADGTCTWLLEEQAYIEWKTIPQSSLVVTGHVGCGKSMLCSMIVQNLQEEHVPGLAYFYVNLAEKLSFGKIVSALLRQLLEQVSVIPAPIYEAFESRRSLPLSDEGLVAAFWEALSALPEGVVVIDGLDELELPDRIDTLKFLSRAQDLNFKWILFSRPCAGLDLPGKQRVKYHIDSQNDADIRSFVRSRLHKSPHLIKNPEILEGLTHTIVEKASGNFLWAKLVLDQIIRQNSFKNMRLAVERLPNELADIYEIMWRSLDEATKIAVSLVALSPRLLTKTQLQNHVDDVALDADILEGETWTFETNGFLFTTASNEVRMVHFTAQEWVKARALTEALQINLDARSSSKVGVTEELAGSQGIGTKEEVALLENLDETSSVTSYSSSIFSKDSEMSSQTSISSVLSQLETVVEQFSRLFINHQAAQLVIQAFLENKGQDGFEGVFSSLLRDYSCDLKVIATSGAQQVAAIMAGDKADAIAHQVVLMSEYLEPSKVITHMTSKQEQEGRKLMLDRFLRQRDDSMRPRTSQPRGEKMEAERKHITGMLEIDLDKGNNRGPEPPKLETPLKDILLATGAPAPAATTEEVVYLNLERIKGWLISSPPFQTLVDRLSAKMHAPLKLPPIPQDSASNDGDDDAVWYKRWKTNAFKATLNAIPGGERPLAIGMKRVRWTCVCRRQFYDDFYEIKPGAVREIQRGLDRVYAQNHRAKRSQASAGHRKAHFWASALGIPLISALLMSYISAKASLADILSRVFCSIILLSSVSIILISILVSSSIRAYSVREKSRRSKALAPLDLLPGTEDFANQTQEPGSIENPLSSAGHQHEAAKKESSTSDNIGGSRSRPGGKRIKGHSSEKATDSPLESSDTSISSQSSDSETPGRRPGLELARNQLWVLALFANIVGEEVYVHLNAVRRATDFTLFSGFREKYYLISSPWQRFTQLRQVSSIRFVKFILADQKRGDVVKKDVWPPVHEPRVWLYEPYPAVENVPLVGPKYLMNIWRDTHHADTAAYDEFQRTASWQALFVDWLRSVPHLIFQYLRQQVAHLGDLDALDDDGLDPSLATDSNNLPPNLHPTDIEQPAQQLRATRIIGSVPKKIGQKLTVNFRDHTYPEAWGLEFEETFHVHRLLFFILWLYAVCSVVLLAWLFHRYGLGVPSSLRWVLFIFGWVVTLFGLTVTVWLKWAENR